MAGICEQNYVVFDYEVRVCVVWVPSGVSDFGWFIGRQPTQYRILTSNIFRYIIAVNLKQLDDKWKFV